MICWPCECGSFSCADWIVGSFFEMNPERKRAYVPYAPDFIAREYRRRQRSAT